MNKKWQERLAWLSAIGFVISLVWNLALRAGLLEPAGDIPRPAFFVLFMGVFAVFMPTVFSMQRFAGRTRGFDLTFGLRTWKYMMKGAPPWALWVAGAAFVYAMLNFFAEFQTPGTDLAHSTAPDFELIATGHCLAFYAISAAINWAAVRRTALGIDWVCDRGHDLSPTDRFCPQCGAPARNADYKGSLQQ